MFIGKPKLGLESTRTFLELTLKRVSCQKDSDNMSLEAFNNFPMFSLGGASRQMGLYGKSFGVKFFCISKLYLFCSRKASFDVYRLNLHLSRNTGALRVCIVSKCYDSSWDSSTDLPFESAYNLIKLLKPPYIGARFDVDAEISREVLDVLKAFEKMSLGLSATAKLVKILDDTEAKIGLFLSDSLSRYGVCELLSLFASRLHQLFCNVSFLDKDEPLLSALLDRLTVNEVRASGQISRILRYQVKQLNLNFYKSYGRETFKIDDKNLIGGENLALKKLVLNCRDIGEDDFEKLAASLRVRCPNLNQLEIDALFDHGEIASNQITDNVIACVRRMKKFKESVLSNLTNVSMRADFRFTIDQENDVWHKEISKNTEFKGWKFQSSTRGLDRLTERKTLKMTLINEGIKLNAVFRVDFPDYDSDHAYCPSCDGYRYDSD